MKLTEHQRQNLPIPSAAEIEARLKASLCLYCGEVAANNIYSEEGKKEYHISGMCELCFDAMTKEEH